jgi:hypothetical protein
MAMRLMDDVSMLGSGHFPTVEWLGDLWVGRSTATS